MFRVTRFCLPSPDALVGQHLAQFRNGQGHSNLRLVRADAQDTNPLRPDHLFGAVLARTEQRVCFITVDDQTWGHSVLGDQLRGDGLVQLHQRLVVLRQHAHFGGCNSRNHVVAGKEALSPGAAEGAIATELSHETLDTVGEKDVTHDEVQVGLVDWYTTRPASENLGKHQFVDGYSVDRSRAAMNTPTRRRSFIQRFKAWSTPVEV
jgi:hypothetical protein